jgi:hypothetical protein
MKKKTKKILWAIERGLDFSLIGFLFLTGALLNTYAVARNDGRMPVYTPINYSSTDKHFITSNLSEIREPQLVDKFSIFPRGMIFSLGDIFMFFGIYLYLAKATIIIMKVYDEHKRKKHKLYKRRSIHS